MGADFQEPVTACTAIVVPLILLLAYRSITCAFAYERRRSVPFYKAKPAKEQLGAHSYEGLQSRPAALLEESKT